MGRMPGAALMDQPMIKTRLLGPEQLHEPAGRCVRLGVASVGRRCPLGFVTEQRCMRNGLLEFQEHFLRKLVRRLSRLLVAARQPGTCRHSGKADGAFSMLGAEGE